MSIYKPEKEPCQVCGRIDLLYGAPFPLAPDIPVCPDCIETVQQKAGCTHWEGLCLQCPLWPGHFEEDYCPRKPFPLKLIGYDPNVTYVKPRQLTLF